MEFIDNGVCAPLGFKANGVHCGIRKNKTKLDLGIIVADVPCVAAAVYTQNKVVGAPILVTRENIKDGVARAIICNSGNANTCNADGVEKANMMCGLLADALGISPKDVVVASTGVIGQTMPIEPIASGMDELVAGLSANGSDKMAVAIMTTDTFKKEYALQFVCGEAVVKIGAIAKGSGMIHPNMATMLSFVTTDANISREMLDKALRAAVNETINMVSVDGDTSTNDTMCVMASCLAKNAKITAEGESYNVFALALNTILTAIAKDLARDGEGATKLMICKVSGAKTEKDARAIAKSVITSNLLKCAMFASDANWGRILCAIGYADAQFDINGVGVDLVSQVGRIPVCRNGSGVAFAEETATQILSEKEIVIDVTLTDGDQNAVAYGCDLTYNYIKINADYRT